MFEKLLVLKVYSISFSSRDRDHGGPEGMEPDGVIEVCTLVKSGGVI